MLEAGGGIIVLVFDGGTATVWSCSKYLRGLVADCQMYSRNLPLPFQFYHFLKRNGNGNGRHMINLAINFECLRRFS